MVDPRTSYQLRTNIKNLMKQKKPVIILAKYFKNENEDTFITFYDVHLYSSGNIMPEELCHHVTIFQSQILELTGKYWHAEEHKNGDTYVLVCRPYLYSGSQNLNMIRGGLKLTSELGIAPITLAKNLNKEIPQDLYYDYRQAANVKFEVLKSHFKKTPCKEYIPQGMSKQNKSKIIRQRKRIQRKRKVNMVLKLIQYVEASS